MPMMYRFPTEDNLKYHLSTHTEERDKKGNIIYQCPELECSDEATIYQTAMWSEFKYHAWKEHQVIITYLSYSVTYLYLHLATYLRTVTYVVT